MISLSFPSTHLFGSRKDGTALLFLLSSLISILGVNSQWDLPATPSRFDDSVWLTDLRNVYLGIMRSGRRNPVSTTTQHHVLAEEPYFGPTRYDSCRKRWFPTGKAFPLRRTINRSTDRSNGPFLVPGETVYCILSMLCRMIRPTTFHLRHGRHTAIKAAQHSIVYSSTFSKRQTFS